MARTRNIKPGFFANELLAEIDPLGRLLFAGLWTIADREGRLEDRPKKIGAAVLPYDQCDVDGLLQALSDRGFLIRYAVDGNKYIQVVNWSAHQQPHIKEQASVIPAPDMHGAGTVQAPDKPGASTELAGEEHSPRTPRDSPLDTGNSLLEDSSLDIHQKKDNLEVLSARAREEEPEPDDDFFGSLEDPPTETPDDTLDVDRRDGPPLEETETVCAAGRPPNGPSGEAVDKPPPDPWDRSTWDRAAKVPPMVWRDLDAMDGLDREKQLDKLVSAFNSRYKEQHKRYGVGGSKKARDLFRQCIIDGYLAQDIFVEIVFDDGNKDRPPWEIIDALMSVTGTEHTNSMTLHGMLDFDRKFGIKEYGTNGPAGNAQSHGP